MLVPTSARQIQSAQGLVTRVGMRHGDHCVGRIVLGVSEADTYVGQLVHFCPAQIFNFYTLSLGDGKLLPDTEDYQVVIARDLPEVPGNGFLVLDVAIYANGCLSFVPMGDRAIFLPSPPRIAGDAPFAYKGGLEHAVDAYGQVTFAQTIARYGRSLQLAI